MTYVEQQAAICAKSILLQNIVGNGITADQMTQFLVSFANSVMAAQRKGVIAALQKEVKTLEPMWELSENFKQTILNAEVQP